MTTDSTLIVQATGAFFGGPTYDTNTRSYRNPTVSGLGAVYRGRPNEQIMDDFFLNQPPGTASGSVMVVRIAGGVESRVAIGGATDGIKDARHAVELHVYVMSTEAYSEDVNDYTFLLRDNIINKMHTDRTFGTGGFEAGTGIGFMVGEGGSPWIKWSVSEVETEANWKKQYLLIEFDAIMMIQA